MADKGKREKEWVKTTLSAQLTGCCVLELKGKSLVKCILRIGPISHAGCVGITWCTDRAWWRSCNILRTASAVMWDALEVAFSRLLRSYKESSLFSFTRLVNVKFSWSTWTLQVLKGMYKIMISCVRDVQGKYHMQQLLLSNNRSCTLNKSRKHTSISSLGVSVVPDGGRVTMDDPSPPGGCCGTSLEASFLSAAQLDKTLDTLLSSISSDKRYRSGSMFRTLQYIYSWRLSQSQRTLVLQWKINVFTSKSQFTWN